MIIFSFYKITLKFFYYKIEKRFVILLYNYNHICQLVSAYTSLLRWLTNPYCRRFPWHILFLFKIQRHHLYCNYTDRTLVRVAVSKGVIWCDQRFEHVRSNPVHNSLWIRAKPAIGDFRTDSVCTIFNQKAWIKQAVVYFACIFQWCDMTKLSTQAEIIKKLHPWQNVSTEIRTWVSMLRPLC